ncbi:MAG: hypothetical protein ABEH40_03915 [Haloferacaceae archaeon]
MELGRPPSGTAERPRSVLLLEGADGEAADRLCIDLLAGERAGETRLLFVTLVDSPEKRMRAWDAAADRRPAEAVAVGMAGARNGPDGPDGVDVRTVSDPANLTRLGVVITGALADLDGEGPSVCFHSLSVLLQYAPVEQVFRFLSVLNTHLDAAGAAAHFHFDPSIHDDRTLATLRPLFDEVVRADGD